MRSDQPPHTPNHVAFYGLAGQPFRHTHGVSAPAEAPDTCEQYIDREIQEAGGEASIFTPDAVNLLCQAAGQNRGKLDVLCETALIIGAANRLRPIGAETVREAIAMFEGHGKGAAQHSRRTGLNTVVGGFAAAIMLIILGVMYWVESDGSSGDPRVASSERDMSRTMVATEPGQESGEPIPSAPAPPHSLGESRLGPQVGDAPAARDARAPIPAPDKAPDDEGRIAESREVARLLAVLLDSGRIVVGRAQSTINNIRLEDKGFSSAVFESQLRKEFLARTGHDLRNLAPAPMPEFGKPYLVRLAFFMQKAVQEAQPDINKKGVGFKGFIPATFATKVAERFSKDTKILLRQIGPPTAEPRNPGNKPDPAEMKALLSIQRSHPRVGDHVIEQQLPDRSTRVLLPLFYTKQCLFCHGKPKGELDISGYEKEGYREGDLGGAISATLPPTLG